MPDLKEEWKDTGKEVSKALESLGKSLVRSAKEGIKKLDEWANEESAKTEENKSE